MFFATLGQTPERIEFENATAMSDGEPSLENIIDENEWTDRNFGSGTEESSEIYSTDDSESDSDLDNYEEAMESPLGAQTLQLATDWIGKQRYSSNQYSDDDESDDDEFYDSSEGKSGNIFLFNSNALTEMCTNFQMMRQIVKQRERNWKRLDRFGCKKLN